MKLDDTLEKAFSDQITLELAASVTYFQLATSLAQLNLPGMASWMRHQSDEERHHALLFTDHVEDRGNVVTLGAISAPGLPGATALDVFQAALAHERKVSQAIRDLYSLANQQGDVDSLPLLQRFLEEQIEEESTVSEIIGRLERAGEDGSAILYLDSELGTRSTAEH